MTQTFWTAWFNKTQTSTSKMHCFDSNDHGKALCGVKFPYGAIESGWADNCYRCQDKIDAMPSSGTMFS